MLRCSRGWRSGLKKWGGLRKGLAICVLALAFCLSVNAEKKPSQPDVVQGCVSVTAIHSHPSSALSILEGLDATVRNTCAKPAIVTIAIGYFDKKGEQFGSAFEIPTVGPGADFHVKHVTTLNWAGKGRLKSVRVIAVTVAPLP